VGGGVVRVLAAIDKQLEKAKVLPELEATPEAPDVIDPSTGELKGEYRQVWLELHT